MKTLTLISALAIGLFCTSFIPYPDDARIICTGNSDCKVIRLPNGLNYTVKYAFFHRFHRRFTCAIVGELQNPTNGALNLNREQFSIRCSDSTRFSRNPFGVSDPYDMFERIKIQPDVFQVKAGQQLDYVFSWHTDAKISLNDYRQRIALDTITFFMDDSKPIALFKIVLDPRRHHGG